MNDTPEMNETPAMIGSEQILELNKVLNRYAAGIKRTHSRIISSERWWQLRNAAEEGKETEDGWRSVSGWLHNVLTSKHADMIEAFPEPNILPREVSDVGEAQMLSSIIPCILEQNQFEETYNECMWQKVKYGTGIYKIVWDASKLGGLGDIAIEPVNPLNLYWEPSVKDIQKSRYIFHTELVDKDVLRAIYPQLADKLKSPTFVSSKFLQDEEQQSEDKATVIDVYYHKTVGGINTVQYIKYVGDEVLFATENDPELSVRGLYDHGRYPYEFDALFPVEGSPCGYGFVDVCRSPQTEIDNMKTAFNENIMVTSKPRYFARSNDTINEEEFLDTRKPIVHVNGNVDDSYLRPIETKLLDGASISMYDRTIDELRQTSGNTETSTGTTSSGVTAASAIAALQEASGKGSRDAIKGSYRSFGRIVEIVIELMRQFYDAPRKFRILGEYGTNKYVEYQNAGLKPVQYGEAFGADAGVRKPLFDVKISAQKKNVYTKITQNEMALQFYGLGFFDPMRADQTLACLSIMEFDGKDELMQKIAQNGTLMQKLAQYMQIAFAATGDARIAADMQQTLGVQAPVGGAGVQGMQQNKEPANVENARERAAAASQPA
ncbi:MAG: hypothetical protein IIX86_09070 [Clostridia bacterium]|nr:hypothetical protein [Clostridia bacterium]